jgi:hypothetical protein
MKYIKCFKMKNNPMLCTSRDQEKTTFQEFKGLRTVPLLQFAPRRQLYIREIIAKCNPLSVMKFTANG